MLGWVTRRLWILSMLKTRPDMVHYIVAKRPKTPLAGSGFCCGTIRRTGSVAKGALGPGREVHMRLFVSGKAAQVVGLHELK